MTISSKIDILIIPSTCNKCEGNGYEISIVPVNSDRSTEIETVYGDAVVAKQLKVGEYTLETYKDKTFMIYLVSEDRVRGSATVLVLDLSA